MRSIILSADILLTDAICRQTNIEVQSPLREYPFGVIGHLVADNQALAIHHAIANGQIRHTRFSRLPFRFFTCHLNQHVNKSLFRQPAHL
jgi:hypothetical protein